ncbi:MAG: FkbM family methyltransferase [Gammaproteobacteria bacterium]|nr:FkbM family methyltransferase [Gammaproteobacteria bacterium]
MLLALHDAIAVSRLKSSGLDYLLPRLVAKLQSQFCRFVDVGAGVGTTALEYHEILKQSLGTGFLRHLRGDGPRASITCYEPLPENFAELSKRLAGLRECRLREAAAWNENGTEMFTVPNRQTAAAETWGVGTSWEGTILPNKRKRRKYESVEVRTVRLEDDLDEVPDFVKLDLQGGEMPAIEGLGDMLDDIKLLYVETQLMKQEPTCQFLADNGFVVMYDKYQAALSHGVTRIPAQALRDLGIVIDDIVFVPGTSEPPVMWGHFTTGQALLDGYSIAPAARDALWDLGISYVQVDALCINRKYQDMMLTELEGVI